MHAVLIRRHPQPQNQSGRKISRNRTLKSFAHYSITVFLSVPYLTASSLFCFPHHPKGTKCAQLQPAVSVFLYSQMKSLAVSIPKLITPHHTRILQQG